MPQEVQGTEEVHGGGRHTGPPADGGDGDCEGNGGSSSRAGEDKEEDSAGGLFPSSRPLRVFVSQGDVVYVDEVEAVAIRGGDAGAATAQDSTDGDTCGEKGGEIDGKSAGESAEETSQQRASGGERAPPAFFDPLLNPGSNGAQKQQGGAWSSAVLLLVPLRLGLDELSAGYIPSEPFPACLPASVLLPVCLMDVKYAVGKTPCLDGMRMFTPGRAI